MKMNVSIKEFMKSESYLFRMQTTATMMTIIKTRPAAEPATPPPIIASVLPLSLTERTQIKYKYSYQYNREIRFFYHRKSQLRKYIFKWLLIIRNDIF